MRLSKIDHLPTIAGDIPCNHQGINFNDECLVWKNDLIPSNIGDVIIKKWSDLIPEIIKAMINTVENRSDLLTVKINSFSTIDTVTDTVYSTLHAVLVYLSKKKYQGNTIEKDYLNRISNLKGILTNKVSKTLEEKCEIDLLNDLYNGSYSLQSVIKWKQFQLLQAAIGYMIPSKKIQDEIKPEEIRIAIKDRSNFKLIIIITKLIAHFKFEKFNQYNTQHNEFIVPDPDYCTQKQAIISFGLIFQNMGNFTLEEVKVKVVAMSILASEIESSQILHKLSKKILFEP